MEKFLKRKKFMKKHINIKIYGQVQGVNFRYWAQVRAKEIGIVGLVRNEPDGTVYIEAEGENKLLKNFLTCCQQGPRWAKVSRAKHQLSSQLKGYEDFIIQY